MISLLTAHAVSTFEYPVDDVEKLFLEGDSIAIFSYGSLLNRESAARTLSLQAVESIYPAVAFGYVRLFNRHVPTTSRWGSKKRDHDTAMLNLMVLEGGEVNGVVFHAMKDDMIALLKREEGYDLVPVQVVPWNDYLSGSRATTTAYAFVAAEEPRQGVEYTSRHINPVPGYAFASKMGASEYGETFLQMWEESTFLADGVTPFAAWEESPQIDCQYEDGCR